jgi:hypothetical protein
MVRHFIAQARQRRPVVPPGVSEYIVQSYVRLRKEHKEQEEENKTHSYTSARTLLAVLRLSQALARLRFAETVDTTDVDEALRLMEASKESLEERTEEGVDGDRTVTSRIFRLMKGMATAPGRKRMGRGPGGERDMDMDEDEEGGEMMQVAMIDLRARVLAKGFTETQLMDTIQQVGHRHWCSASFTNSLSPVRVYQYYYTFCKRTVCAVCGCGRGVRGSVMYITEHIRILLLPIGRMCCGISQQLAFTDDNHHALDKVRSARDCAGHGSWRDASKTYLLDAQILRSPP